MPHATRFGAESTSTINFDPIGWKGAKLDAQLGFEKTSVKDPLTGEKRPISGIQDRWASLNLRHDVPHTPLAWGVDASYGHYTKNFFLTEVFRSWEGPYFVDLYVEHKDVFGLTVRATVGNVFNARHRWTRFVYEDWRDTSPVDFIQKNNQLIGPVFSVPGQRHLLADAAALLMAPSLAEVWQCPGSISTPSSRPTGPAIRRLSTRTSPGAGTAALRRPRA